MSSPGNILIVDDTPENLTVLRDILTRAGYRVRPVLRGALALKSAVIDAPDLILLDIMMPEMDGYETCRHLKADPRTRDVPVLYISALDATESKVRGFEAGALDYILKPFRAEEVLARVRTHLALYAAQRQLKSQNEELRQAARLREDVDHMLRHDLRGPLGNMIAYAELIMDETARDSVPARHARVIANAGYATLSMVHSSFDLMKMERGQYALNAEVFDVLEVVRQVMTEMELAAGEKGLCFELVCDDPTRADLVMKGERLLCHSLFYNLFKNAIEASPVGQKVLVRCGSTGSAVEVKVRNVGAVPEAIRERFFDKYATHGKAGGTGLGTFSARLMAETQRGGIKPDFSEDGHTTLVVTFPAAEEREAYQFRAARAEAETAAAPAVRPDSLDFPAVDVLVADDDGANRAYLRHVLPAPPLKVHMAANGHEALTFLQSQRIAVALVDLEMPGMGGLEMARKYLAWRHDRQNPPKPPVLIAFSGHQDEGTRQRCWDAGFDQLLPKPTAREKLYEALKQALAVRGNVVQVDRAIESLIPEFLASQREQAQELENLLVAGNGVAIGSLAHRLQGSLAMYGFSNASRMATSISAAARAGELDRVPPLIAGLRSHLAAVEVNYV